MEELYYQCKTDAPMKFIFTTISGQVVEVKAEHLPVTSPYSPKYDPRAQVIKLEGDDHFRLPAEVVRYLKTKKLEIESLDASTTDGSSDPRASSSKTSMSTDKCSTTLTSPPLVVVSRSASGSSVDGATVPLSMVYNEYGELVSAHAIIHPPHSKDMTVLQILRIIKKGYHTNYRKKLGKIISEQMEGKSSLVVDDGSCIWSQRLSAWEFRASSPNSKRPVSCMTPDETPASVAVFSGPPRVLEIGCGDGNWCFQVKEKYPDWIIDGVDDTNHWSCANKNIVLKDFMESDPSKAVVDYFSTVHSSQDSPEFTIRNINDLLRHEKPIPHNLYGLIRARDIFDKVESYKSFLEDVRLILQPDGVVEFLEVDPRPRLFKAGRSRAETKADHTSGPKTDWTDNIVDRFQNKNDEEFSIEISGWMGRVEQDLKATLRPRDGVPGPQLKSWLEGAGFWDVKHNIIQLHVGGDSKAGQLMKDFILFKHANEDEIPTLKAVLPQIEVEVIESGDYYLNLHIVTGRKARLPRAGDLLLNGTRQEMTALKYEVMARTEAPKSNQWKRFDLDGELTGLVHGLSNLSGAPAFITAPPALTTPKTAPISPLLTVDGAIRATNSVKTSSAVLTSTSGMVNPLSVVDDGGEIRGNLIGKSEAILKLAELKHVEDVGKIVGRGEEVKSVERVEDVGAEQTS